MALSFRNVDADPSDPVESWPYEGLVTAVERGGLADWRRIHRAVQADPWGPVARSLEAIRERPVAQGLRRADRHVIVTAVDLRVRKGLAGGLAGRPDASRRSFGPRRGVRDNGMPVPAPRHTARTAEGPLT